MPRCRASCVSSRVLVGRAIDLLVPRLAAMVPLAPNALEAARTSIAPAETPAGPIIGVPHATYHEPARTTAAAAIAEEQALMAAVSASSSTTVSTRQAQTIAKADSSSDTSSRTAVDIV
jgi:hypothetical protein